MFLTDDEILIGSEDTDQNIKISVPDTDQNISARYFVDLCSEVMGIVWSTTTRTRVSEATAVTFSVEISTH